MLIYSNDLFKNYDSMEAIKEEMVEFDEDERPADDISDDEAYDYFHNVDELNWEQVTEGLKKVDKESSSHWVVRASLGLWDGRFAGGRIFNSLESAIRAMMSDMDYVDIEEDERGNVTVTEHHHDGTNYYTLRRLNKAGEEAYDRTPYERNREVVERLFKPRYSNNARLRKAFGWI